MQSTIGLSELFELSEIPRKTQVHLSKVYSILGTGVLTSLLTFIFCQYFTIISSLFILLSTISLIADISAIFISKSSRLSKNVQLISFYCYALSLGGLLGNNISDLDCQSKVVGYRVCLSALSGCICIFVVFSVFSALTSKRLFIYSLSVISSLVLSIISIFVFNTQTNLILGFSSAILYVIIDTQHIIHRYKFEKGSAVHDAKLLFIDLVKIFFKLYEYFMTKEKDKEKEKKKKK